MRYIPAGYTVTNPNPVRIELSKDLPDNLNGTLFKYLDEKLLTSATKTDGGIRYFVDGWDRPLIFRIPGKFNKMGFDLGSAGADGKIGEDGTEITAAVPSSISDYETKFGKGDDITNFLRKD